MKKNDRRSEQPAVVYWNGTETMKSLLNFGIVDNPAAIVRPSGDLAELAAEINASHTKGENSLKEGLAHFRDCGLALLAAKEKCGHGKWLAWMKDNVRFDRRTATNYMAVASKWETVSHLSSLRDALRLLRDDANDGYATNDEWESIGLGNLPHEFRTEELFSKQLELWQLALSFVDEAEFASAEEAGPFCEVLKFGPRGWWVLQARCTDGTWIDHVFHRCRGVLEQMRDCDNDDPEFRVIPADEIEDWNESWQSRLMYWYAG